MNKLEKIYLHTGSNLGQKEEHLEEAKRLIEKRIGPITAESRLFETEAWGLTKQPNFINQALEVVSNLSPELLMEQILEIELTMGRIRDQKWAPRLIDIDILFYGDQIIKKESLTIPHPHMHERNFVLAPLMEIAKGFIHPEFGLSIRQLYQDSKDPLNVKANDIS